MGQLALPGGFVDHNETLQESAIRELKEETKLADRHGPFPVSFGRIKSFYKQQGYVLIRTTNKKRPHKGAVIIPKCQDQLDVETVQIHDFGESSDKVLDEHLFCIITGINFGDGTQL